MIPAVIGSLRRSSVGEIKMKDDAELAVGKSLNDEDSQNGLKIDLSN